MCFFDVLWCYLLYFWPFLQSLSFLRLHTLFHTIHQTSTTIITTTSTTYYYTIITTTTKGGGHRPAGSAGQQYYGRRQRSQTGSWPMAAQANRIMAGGSEGQQHYGQRQCRQKAEHYGHRQGMPIELGPEILATTRILDA